MNIASVFRLPHLDMRGCSWKTKLRGGGEHVFVFVLFWRNAMMVADDEGTGSLYGAGSVLSCSHNLRKVEDIS